MYKYSETKIVQTDYENDYENYLGIGGKHIANFVMSLN